MTFLNIILPLIYFLLFSALVFRTRLFKYSILNKVSIWSVFLLKVLAGTTYVALYKYYYGGTEVDIFNYFQDSKVLYQEFFNEPIRFIRMMIWSPGMSIPADLSPYLSQMSYWTVWGDYTMVRYNTLLLFISNGSIWVHMVITCFLSLIGLVGLFEFFYRQVRRKLVLLFIAVFLFPSVLFWGSGVHKEALIFLGMGGALYQVYTLRLRPFSLKKWLLLLLALFVLFMLRPYIILLGFPGVVALLWTSFRPRWSFLKYAVVYAILFWVIQWGGGTFYDTNIYQSVVDKRVSFQKYSGEANLTMRSMNPNFFGLVKQVPEALDHTLLHPYLGEIYNVLVGAVGVENYLFLLLFLLCLFYAYWPSLNQQSLWCFCLFFGGSFLLLIGLTVNNIGAIARYKAQIYPFLLVFCFLLVSKKRLPVFLR